MFSLQTIFGQGKQFYALLNDAAAAAHDSTKALHAMLKAPERTPALEAFKLARHRLTFVLVVILAALVFEFINGFHDTATSIATVVATKVLSPGQAVVLAAVASLIGAFRGTAVAKTIPRAWWTPASWWSPRR